MPHEKRCRVCGALKPTDDFYTDARMRDGLRNLCKACHCLESTRLRAIATEARCSTSVGRFTSRVQRSAGCWQWTGAKTAAGYGQLRLPFRRVPVYAHRFSYEAHVGPIGDGLTLDHLCRNRACVNPAHLEPVTNAENIRRGAAARRREAAA